MVLIFLLLFVVLLSGLVVMQRKYVKFSTRVFAALGIGVTFGALLQYVAEKNVVTQTLDWISLVGDGYVRLLQMIVMPLIFVSILTAILKLKEGGRDLGKIGGMVLSILIGTAVVAALVGIGVANGFHLSAEGMQMGDVEMARAEVLEKRLTSVESVSLAQQLVTLIPKNFFSDLAGGRDAATIGVVIFTIFLGIAALGTRKKHAQSFELFFNFTIALHDVVLRFVTLILRLTPYGVMALMANVIASSSIDEILNLGKFVLASYVAIIIVFVFHLLLLLISGINPITYLRRALPVLTFAFTSRSSLGTMPLNIETQIDKMGVDEGVANLSASLGATIGQNGCAAIYPAMVAVMIAPVVGIDPTNLSFITTLVVTIAIASLGVAGVGGGATFASLIVLSSMNFPVALVGLLISVEPLIDMGRTALNVNDAMISGVITSKLLGKTKPTTDESFSEEV